MTFCSHVQYIAQLNLISQYLAVVFEGKVEREAADTLRLRARRDLQALYNTGVTLVLKTRILALSVLTDDGKVHVVVTRRESGEGLAEYDRGIDVKLLAHGDVPRNVASSGDGGEEDT